MEQQRSALVTGAARGIGRAIADRLLADGLAVSYADLPSTRTSLETALAAAGPGAQALEVDVVNADSVQVALDAHIARFGGLDVLVANAGIAITAPVLETTPEQWQQTMEVNLRGVLHCYQSAARQMITQGRGGRLIAAGSVAAHRGGKWQGAYSASKFAVRGLSQSLAQELAEHQITVNLYSPGVVDTAMWTGIDEAVTARRGTDTGSELSAMAAQIPLGRLETPADVAGLVSFLASGDSAYVTGQSFVVDGGLWFS